MPSPSHYEVIGLDRAATQADIEARYRELARLYQLDGGPPGEGMGSLIAEAYRVLSNPALRAVYDASPGGPPAPSPAPPNLATSQGSPALERTQEIASPPPSPGRAPTLERTVEIPPPAQRTEIEERQLAAELSRRGISPDEVRRLVAPGRDSHDTATKGKRQSVPTAPAIPPSTPFVPKPTISLPQPRESSSQERAEADRLLTSANIARRRDKFREAEALCRQAVELVPSDAAALELYGDVLQATGRVDDAVLAYKRANEIDPTRRSAEKKYGDLVLRQDRSIALIKDENLPGNAHVAVLLSAVFPGGGQIYNGDVAKGIITAIAFLATLYLIFYSPYGLPHDREGIPTSLAISIAVASLVYLFAVVDANLVARRGRRRASGWEV
jgi:curved DNA-binding protein CbpA